MKAKLIEGKPIAEKLKAEMSQDVEVLKAKYGIGPKLVALQAGDNAASAIYVKAQKKAAESIGIDYELKTLPAESGQGEIERAIINANEDDNISGIILQLPLPKGVDAKKTAGVISPAKDAEGMHPQNIGKILTGQFMIGPCTPLAVMELLASTGVDLYGKDAVVVGHSEIVGKPLALMLLNKFATTTVCHIATGERGVLQDHVRRAEVLVVAVGRVGIVKGEWVKDGAIVVDVGINRVGDKVVGDVEFESASERASYITPVPGGVGPLTTAILMRNTIALFKAQHT